MQQEQIGWSDGNVINNSTYPQCEPLCEMNKDCKGIRWIVGASDSQSSLINQCQLLSTLGDTNTDIRWRHAIKGSGTQQDSDLLDILTQEAEMKNAINSYEQIIADKPSESCTPMPPLGGLTSSTWIETIRNNMQKNIPWYIGLPESWWYGKTGEDAINIIETACVGTVSSKNDLLMRRKAQVLQHQNNSSKLTKKQQLSKILRTSLPLSKKTANCPTSTTYPSSASDVPGNSILKLDLNIPPWGANYQRRSFAMGNSNTTRPSLFGP